MLQKLQSSKTGSRAVLECAVCSMVLLSVWSSLLLLYKQCHMCAGELLMGLHHWRRSKGSGR